jgi:hypothetical protein
MLTALGQATKTGMARRLESGKCGDGVGVSAEEGGDDEW